VTTTQGSFDPAMDPERRMQILSNLNQLTNTAHLQAGDNGQIMLVQRHDIEEQFPISNELLTRVFEDGDKPLYIAGREAASWSGIDAGTHFLRGDITSRWTLDEGTFAQSIGYKIGSPDANFLFFDPNLDNQHASFYVDANGQHLERIGAEPPIALAHELIHADRALRGAPLNTDDSREFVLHNEEGGERGTIRANVEEAVVVGPPVELGPGERVPSPSYGLPWYERLKFWNPPISENDIRAEQGLPLRLDYPNPLGNRDQSTVHPLPQASK